MVNTMWEKIKEHIVFSLIGLIFTIIGGVILFHYQELWKNLKDPTVPNSPTYAIPKDQPLKNDCIYKWDKISRNVVLMKKVGDSWVPASSDECMQKL